MSNYLPSAYSPEALAWAPPPSTYKEQVLSHKLGEAGMLVQDILSGVETVRGRLGSSDIEVRRAIFENVNINLDMSESALANVKIEQKKQPYLHHFLVLVDFEFPGQANRRGLVAMNWGVDNPEHQVLTTRITDYDETGRVVHSKGDTSYEFDEYFKNLLKITLTQVASLPRFNDRQTKPAGAPDIEAALLASQEKSVAASFDSRLVDIVETVYKVDGTPLNYEAIAQMLDDIEQDYELQPLEIVEAYGMCEARRADAEEA